MPSTFICVTCGVEHSPGPDGGPPTSCAICEDERQYVGWRGQRWTTLEDMARDGYRNELRQEEPGLTGISTSPSFAIGQRALLVQTPAGNVLWDCISYVDEPTINEVRALGGVQAIAISHPHFYGSMTVWSEAFGGAPIFIPSADRQWVMRPSPAVEFWDGESLELVPGLTLLRLGGHFAGSCVLHWPAGAAGRGAILSGDTLQVVQDRRYVSFMYSYPNLIPLPAATIRAIVETVSRYPFDRIYGGWNGRVVAADGLQAVVRSAQRYLTWIGES